jgi:hypothetical protein
MFVYVCVSSTLCHAGHILTPFQDTTLFSAQLSTSNKAFDPATKWFYSALRNVLQCLGTMVTAAFADRNDG